MRTRMLYMSQHFYGITFIKTIYHKKLCERKKQTHFIISLSLIQQIDNNFRGKTIFARIVGNL